MDIKDRKTIIWEQFEADFGLSRADTSSDVVIVGAKKYGDSARKYLSGKPFADMVYFDGKLIAAVDQAIMPFFVKYISAQTQPFRAFDAPGVFILYDELKKHGYSVGNILQGYLLGDDAAVSAKFSDVRFFREREIEQLYVNKNLNDAFCYSTTAKRRDVLAAAVFDEDKLAAVAACSNDGESMWQIGVDVLPEYRRKGFGTKVVRALAAETERQGICAYYCCAWSNVASMRTARAAGFVPCWVELSAARSDGDLVRNAREKVYGGGG